MVKSVINEGYRIPFIDDPSHTFLDRGSARMEYDFATKSVLELQSSNRITEKNQPSHIISLLSVAQQASGKKRLILDLSRLNNFLQKTHFKLDDWKIGLQDISKDAFIFTFDLKSGYHHLDISFDYQNTWDFPG